LGLNSTQIKLKSHQQTTQKILHTSNLNNNSHKSLNNLNINQNQNHNNYSNTQSNSSKNQNISNNNIPSQTLCLCGKQAVQLTVKKDGPNMGRKFYSCADNKTCDFFLWCDGENNINNNNNNYNNNNQIGESETKMCQCEIPALQLTVRKEGPNQNKKFYKCSQDKCKFFEWAEDINKSMLCIV
jgi:DNA topoisomerase-3